MDNDSVLEQIVRSLSFEVEAIPHENIIQLTTSTKSAPLNVKIRVRKKEDAGFQHGFLSLPKPNQPDSIPERVRLVSSDQTIMSFDVVMEGDFQKPNKRPRKNIMRIFKPTICLGAQPDEDKYAYLPNKSYKVKINEDSTSKSKGPLTKFTLAEDVGSDEASATPQKKKTDIFGKYKPGGCLDPPFGEDIHPYSLAQDTGQRTPARKEVAKGTEQNARQATKNKVRTSSILSNKLFNRKKKNSNDEALDKNVIKTETKTESVLDLYQAGGSLQTCKTYSNSIMTYPPTLNSSEKLQTQEEKQRGSRIYSDTSKNSINQHSGNYFMMPRMIKSLLEKNNTDKIEDDVNVCDSSVIKVQTNTRDKNTIVRNRNLEDDKNQTTLQTKDLATDVSRAEKCLIQSSSSKDRKVTTLKLIDNSDSYTTQLEKDKGYKKSDFTFFIPDQAESKLNIPIISIIIPSNNNKEPKAAQKQEESTFTKIERTEPNIILSGEDTGHGELQKQEESTFTKIESFEVNKIPADKDKGLKGPQKEKYSTLTEKEPSKSNVFTLEKDKRSQKQEDSTLKKIERTELNNILPEKNNGQIESPKHNESTFDFTKTEPNESFNISSERDEGTRATKQQNDSKDGKNAMPSEKDSRINELQEQQDSVFTKINLTELNTVPSKKYIGLKELQKQEDFRLSKTEPTEPNIHIIPIPIPIIIPSKIEKESKEQEREDSTLIKTERSELNDISSEKENGSKVPLTLLNPTLEKTELIKSNNTLEKDEVALELANENQDLIIQKPLKSPSNTVIKKQETIDESKLGSDVELDDFEKPINIMTNQLTTKKKKPELATDNQKSASINEPNFEKTQTNTDDTLLSQVAYENKSGNKSTGTLDAEFSDFGDEIFTRIPTPIESDTPLDIIPNEAYDLQQRRESKNNSLESEANFITKNNELNKQKDKFNKMPESLQDNNKETFELTSNTSFSNLQNRDFINTEYENYLKEDVTKSITNELQTVAQNENIVLKSADSTVSPIDVNDINVSQNLENTPFVKQESEKVGDDMGFSQAKPLEETTEQTQTKVISHNTLVEPEAKTINNDDDVYTFYEFDKNKDNTEPSEKLEVNREQKEIKNTIESTIIKEPQRYESKSKQQVQSITDSKLIAKQNIDQNKDQHIKKITFDNDFEAENQNFPESESNLDSTAAGKRDKTISERYDKQFPDKNNLIQIQTSGITTKHKTSPVIVNLAIQSYVNDNDQVIIKSFDADNVPKLYPHNNVKIIKRYLENDDRVHIPIDSENDLCLQIKNNKLWDINEADEDCNNPDTTRKNIMAKNPENRLDQIKRNAIIADEIQKTLVAVYEQELLPLRNTISELKDNMKTLTANHLLIKGHMFVRKPRSAKLVPLYRKCGCMKK